MQHEQSEPLPSPTLPTDRRSMLAGIGGLAAGAFIAGKANAGPLTPPTGPIASTPGPEPRIAINATNTPGDANSVFRITQPGSYYLTDNITGVAGRNGIEIVSSRVTLDLMGYALIGVPGSDNGINMNSFRDSVVIRNGHVFGWSGSGLKTRIDNGAVEGVHCYFNTGWGFDNNTSYSFRFSGCSALANGTASAPTGGFRVGEATSVTDCQARNNAGPGFVLEGGSSISGCLAANNTDVGITASFSGLIADCTTKTNGRGGIEVGSNSLVRGNLCSSNSLGAFGFGVRIDGADNRVEDNNCVGNRVGIDCTSAGNFIARNTCSGSTLVNWSIVAGNKCLVVNGANAGVISGDSGGTSPGSTNPNANYTY
ncbi:MAG: right-handed parallel beta-helix repeat-containing protein [Phycisphaerales bacterium]|nr:right-handed parallel beta-helix repeat-containing protein [Phycisphaerales bacterium]